MKTLYSCKVNGFLQLQKKFQKTILFLFAIISGIQGFTQPCPTPTLSAPAICQGQPVSLNLATAPGSSGPYTVVINGNSYSGIVPGTPFTPVSNDENFWGLTVPTISGFEDPNPYELGLKFSSNTAGVIRGIRFYRNIVSNGPFTGSLWTSTGTLLATGTFTVSGSGWQNLYFSSPVTITPGVTYVASYFSPNGRYAIETGRFASTSATSGNGSLTAPASGGPAGPNGVYKSGPTGFPDQSTDDANYFVDVIFAAGGQTTAFNLTSITDGTCLSTGSPLTTANLTINPLPIGTISGPPSGTAGSPVVLSYNPVVGTGPYTVTVSGTTVSGVTPSPSTFVSGNIPATTNYRLWNTPAFFPPYFNDGQPVEVGMKFRSTRAGTVTALRFYKGFPDNLPTVLKLYDAAGTLLASATHVDPTSLATGFQEVTLGTPVAIAANTLYVAAYYNANGDYVSTNGFMTAPRTNGIITVSQNNAADGPNGVFRYGVGGGFPTLSCGTCNGPNYWADVVLNAQTTTYDMALTSITDANGCSSSSSQFITLNVGSPLPVSLTQFTGVAIRQDVKLEWSTASESNNKGFEVERSTDATKWLNVGFVAGNGTSMVKRNYGLTDKNLPTGKYFYRLKQIDLDGRFNFSNILPIDVNGKLSYELNQSFPNPTHGASTITYSIPVKSQVTLTVYDMQGRVVRVLQNGERAAGKYAVTVPSDLLKKGVYYYKLEAGEFKSTRKMIVQ